MKLKAILFTALLALIINAAYAQTECTPYVPTSKGAKWEITHYSPKGKETGKVAYELIDLVDAGTVLTFTIKAISYDKKGKEAYTNIYKAYCKNGQFEFDMAYKLDGTAMEAYQTMEINVDASEFEIPAGDAAAGTQLKDGSLVVKVGSSGVTMFQMTVLITDRKVETREEKTTPAGTFKCLMLSQHVSTKMVIKIEGASKEWYAEEVGLVRSETYNKKGKLTGYSELTKIEANLTE